MVSKIFLATGLQSSKQDMKNIKNVNTYLPNIFDNVRKNSGATLYTLIYFKIICYIIY